MRGLFSRFVAFSKDVKRFVRSSECPVVVKEAGEHTDELTVREVTTLDELERFRDQWELLQERFDNASVFTTFDWVSAWFRHYGGPGTLLVLAAFERDQLLGIAPLYRWNGTLGGVPVRRIDFIGHNFSVPNFVISHRKEEVIDRFMDHVSRQIAAWDVLVLKGIPKSSGEFRITIDCLRKWRHRFQVLTVRVPIVDIHGTWDAYLDKKGKNLKAQFSRAYRRADAVGPVDFRVYQSIPHHQLDGLLDRVFDISLKSWKGKGGSAIGSNGRVASFYREVAAGFNRTGRFHLALLSLGRRDVAYVLGLTIRDDYYHIDTAYDEAYTAISPGTLANLLLIRRLFDDGYRRYLNEGDEGYKSRWTTGHWDASEIVVLSQSWRSRLSNLMKFQVLPLANALSGVWKVATSAGRRANGF